MVDPIRRKLLKTGAAAAAMAATPSVFAQQGGNGESGRFYQRGNVRIRYEETGSGFPLLLIAGGGLNGSTIAAIRGGNPFNTIEAFTGEFRCIYADLRNSAGQSTGPVEIDRPWDSYTDDHIGLMDHPDFVFTVTRDFVKGCQTPVLVLPDDTAGHSLAVAIESAMLAPKGQLSMYPWKDTPEKIPLAVRHVRSFLLSHRPA